MTPQEALVAIARERDIDALIAQPEMLRGHLMDYCRGGNRREFNLLVHACQSRVPQGLRAPSSSVLQVDRIADLARRMVDEHGIGDEHARWAVGTWALALGVSKAAVSDLRPSDPVRPPVPERVPDPAPVADPGRPALVVDASAVRGAYATIGEAIRAPVTNLSPSDPDLLPMPERVPDRAPDPKASGTPPPAPPASRRGLFLGIGMLVVAGGGSGVAYFIVSRPKRLIVDAAGNGDYRTIASAVLGARPQDTIVVRPGTYKESLTIDRDVHIVGEGGRSMVIVEGVPDGYNPGAPPQGPQAARELPSPTWAPPPGGRSRVNGEGAPEAKSSSGQAPVLFGFFSFRAGSATLTGLTIRVVGIGPVGTATGAIEVLAGTPVIEDCDLTSSAGSAVYILGAGANPVIRNCTIRNGKGVGVTVQYKALGTIEKCVISGNAYAGVEIKTGGNPTVRNCEIRDGKQDGVLVWEQGQGTIENCVISGNAYAGVGIISGGNPFIRDCEIRDGQGPGVWVYDQGQGTFTGNTL
ncbi:MAG: hypothetical protein EBT09_10215, partial [Actinobacteria bacterium]|nr:hypothetical protein [Actinomycetota bacterium]